jgi:hypothetical protein
MSTPHTEDTNKTGRRRASEAKATTVLIDYRGITASPEGQKDIPHVRSPRVWTSDKPGVSLLVLQPGLNIVKSSLLDSYAGNAAYESAKAKGAIQRIDAIPDGTQDLLDLIGRCYCKDGLAYIRKTVSERNTDLDDAFAADRAEKAKATLVQAIDKRLGMIRPVSIDSTPYRAQPFVAPQSAASPA